MHHRSYAENILLLTHSQLFTNTFITSSNISHFLYWCTVAIRLVLASTLFYQLRQRDHLPAESMHQNADEKYDCSQQQSYPPGENWIFLQLQTSMNFVKTILFPQFSPYSIMKVGVLCQGKKTSKSVHCPSIIFSVCPCMLVMGSWCRHWLASLKKKRKWVVKIA